MQYELYIDVFFLMNFMMDYLMLMLVRKILKCTATHKNICLGALLGALGTCAVIVIPLPSFIKLICLHTMINTGMVLVGLKIRSAGNFWSAFFLLYLTSFLMGGAVNWIAQYMGGYFRIGCLFFAVLIACWYIVSAGLNLLERLWKLKEFQCEVTLYMGKKVLTISAVIDSGNGLSDALTGKPVHIIDRKAMEKLTEENKIEKIRYIPYRTVQEGEGILPVIVIDKMCIHGSYEKEVLAPLIGVSGQKGFMNGTYEMIIHPDSC